MGFTRAILLCALAAGAAVVAAASAQPAPPQPEYHPSLGDLMTMAVQPRHIKLGISGRARNWAYAAYEAGELRNAFGRIGRTIPTYRQQALPDMFASAILPSMDKLDAAIKAKNGHAFDTAYAQVTAACNSCHMGLGHAAVVIREPTVSPYADQDLTGSPPPAVKRRRRS